ncbi:flagellar hook-associated protein 3 [Collimonas arenae]|uniref:Flagellar hook-associated protein 3 n=1 Tax=Collimonas arenae TaxID=279058 RepID=A0A127QFA4_9BURK|nr:flagellar hook-associated protein FlgL [Collimonas arenae]AMO98841.1 flagellar hook-associated protein 3 [Collimonas arenae]AMP08738.1 flagellar hook-associated protein 3 [Collimonas arenae]
MRISTQSFYDQSLASMGSQQTSLLRIQQQIGSMTKILTPSDDPLGATRALAASQSISLNDQYSTSRAQATRSLGLEDNALQSVTTLLQNIKGLIVQAGNGTSTDVDRGSIATSLQSNYDQLLSLANSDDGNGQFLFAGFKSGSAPFVQQAGGGVQYVGDQGQQLLQVDVSRQMAGSDDGRSIFQSAQGGAGYVTTSAATNTGTGVYGATSVIDATNPDFGKSFAINFTSATTYTITNSDTPPVVTPGTYTAGTPIQFGGLQITLTGAPAAGDSFNSSTAQNANPDMFGALKDLIGALKTPVDNGTPAAKAQLLNSLSTANVKLSNSLDNVLTVRSSVGSRMQELDTLNTNGDTRNLSDKSYLSDIQDLDYTSAITQLYQRQMALQATQQTFVQIRKISLLNYL